jgi:hypothetical protein
MLNHESWRVNREIELKYEDKREKQDTDPYISEMGMKMSEVENNPVALNAYLSDWSQFG